MKLLGWIATILAVSLLVRQIAVVDLLWVRGVCGLLLLALGVVAGLRLGAQSASAYIADLQRLNKVLVEQQREFEEINAILVKQISSESESASAVEPETSSEPV